MSTTPRSAPNPAPATPHPWRTAALIGRVLALFGTAIALAVIALASFWLRTYDRQIAEKQSELQKVRAEVTNANEQFKSARSRLDQVNAELAFTQQAYERIAADLPAGAAQKAIEETLALDKQADALPPVVYIHVSRQDQRKKAEEVQSDLRAKGYTVPGIEYVSQAPEHTQLRYFVRTAEGPALNSTLDLLRSWGIDVDSQYISNPSKSPRTLQPHQFELWFGRDYNPQ